MASSLSTLDENKEDDDDNSLVLHSRRPRKISDTLKRITRMKEARLKLRLISNILKKNEPERTSEETSMLENNPELVEKAEKRATVRCKLKKRVLEIEDPPDILEEKCDQLAEAIKKATNICVYTGAGISTAASIPDYRGPNGVWTLLRKGQQLKPQELSDAEPTKTHMSLVSLYKHEKLKHLVSQNCDGLHLRSGLSKKVLSEVHGNMYLEMCLKCKPHRQYLRLFDVTENTSFRRHHTTRDCHHCKKPLSDTIVHFGEKGRLSAPYRWKEAALAAKNCDIILCLGTSLKVLKKYACLWSMNKKPSNRPKLFIVNLQWTPKDDLSTLKINGKCDEVMERVMNKLRWKIPDYTREKDPLFRMAIPLRPHEYDSVSSKQLQVPDSLKEKFYKKLLKNKSSMKPESIPAKLSTKRNCFKQKPTIRHKNISVHKKALKNSVLNGENDHIVSETRSPVCRCADNNKVLSPQLQSDEIHTEHSMKTARDFCSSLFCWPVLIVLMDHDYLPHEQFWTLLEATGVNQFQKILNENKATEKDEIQKNCECGLNTSESVSCNHNTLALSSSNSEDSASADTTRHPVDSNCVCDKVHQSKNSTCDATFGLETPRIDCKQKNGSDNERGQNDSDNERGQNDSDNERGHTQDGAISKKSNKRLPGWFGKGLIVNKKRKRF